MANITSVSMSLIGPNRTLFIVVAIAGLAMFLFGLLMIAFTTTRFMFLLLGAVFTISGIVRAARVKPTYLVKIASASGEAEALSS